MLLLFISWSRANIFKTWSILPRLTQGEKDPSKQSQRPVSHPAERGASVLPIRPPPPLPAAGQCQEFHPPPLLAPPGAQGPGQRPHSAHPRPRKAGPGLAPKLWQSPGRFGVTTESTLATPLKFYISVFLLNSHFRLHQHPQWTPQQRTQMLFGHLKWKRWGKEPPAVVLLHEMIFHVFTWISPSPTLLGCCVRGKPHTVGRFFQTHHTRTWCLWLGCFLRN